MTTPTTETGIVELKAWPFFGYAPGNYMVRCDNCGETKSDLDKRAISCLECAVKRSKAYTAELQSSAAMPDSTQLLQTMAGAWQPIETFTEPTAPSSGNGVLVADKDGTVGEAYFRNFGDGDDGWWWANTNWGDYPEPERPNNPSHWQPLPEPPAQFRAQEQRS